MGTSVFEKVKGSAVGEADVGMRVFVADGEKLDGKSETEVLGILVVLVGSTLEGTMVGAKVVGRIDDGAEEGILEAVGTEVGQRVGIVLRITILGTLVGI